MPVIFNEFMECAFGCLQSHFTADVTVRFRKPPCLDIRPEDETANSGDVDDQPGTDDPEPDDMEDEGVEETGLALPGPVEDKINAALWPFAQVVLQNLAMLYQSLRIMAMVRLTKHPPAIPVKGSFISQSGLVPYYEMIDGPVEAPQHTIGIPFPSKN